PPPLGLYLQHDPTALKQYDRPGAVLPGRARPTGDSRARSLRAHGRGGSRGRATVAHRAAANASGPSWAFPGLVDLLGEVFQGLGAVLEPLVGRCGAGGAEQVPGADRAVPAAQPVQALFFLIQLGERQLALRDLTGQLGFILAAIRQELAPLGLAFLG